MTPEPASFHVTSLSVSSAEATTLPEVMVTVVIENSGGCAGDCPVIAKVNGKQLAVKDVSIEAGRSTTMTFNLFEEMEGNYTINVNGKSVEFAVVAAESALQQPNEDFQIDTSRNYLWWIIGGVVVLVFVALSILYVVRRRA